MVFSVHRRGACPMSTDDIRCIYSEDTLRIMAGAGYTFKIDGKAISLNNLIKYLRENAPDNNGKAR